MLTRLKSPAAAARWLQEWTTGVLRTDSRQVAPGDCLHRLARLCARRREFVPAALAAARPPAWSRTKAWTAHHFTDARVASLPGLKAQTGLVAAAFYGEPSKTLPVIAVTGHQWQDLDRLVDRPGAEPAGPALRRRRHLGRRRTAGAGPAVRDRTTPA